MRFICFLVDENEGGITMDTEPSTPEAPPEDANAMESVPKDEVKSCQTSADFSQYTPRKRKP